MAAHRTCSDVERTPMCGHASRKRRGHGLTLPKSETRKHNVWRHRQAAARPGAHLRRPRPEAALKHRPLAKSGALVVGRLDAADKGALNYNCEARGKGKRLLAVTCPVLVAGAQPRRIQSCRNPTAEEIAPSRCRPPAWHGDTTGPDESAQPRSNPTEKYGANHSQLAEGGFARENEESTTMRRERASLKRAPGKRWWGSAPVELF